MGRDSQEEMTASSYQDFRENTKTGGGQEERIWEAHLSNSLIC